MKVPSTQFVVVSPATYTEADAKQLEQNPNFKAAQQEFNERMVAVTKHHEAAVKALNDKWGASFSHKKNDRHSYLAYHPRSRVNSRNEQADILNTRLAVYAKYGLGDVPVAQWQLDDWLESVDKRTPEIDRLTIRLDIASSVFMERLTKDIADAGGTTKLRYEKEGELDKFSPKTQQLYRKMKLLQARLDELKEGWPEQQHYAVRDSRTINDNDLDENAAIHAWYDDHPQKNKLGKKKPKMTKHRIPAQRILGGVR